MSKNMKVQIEVTAKDSASPVLNKAAKEAEKSFKQTGQIAQQSSKTQADAARKAAQAREVLGVRSERTIQRELMQTRAAYERLKRSGVASQNELRRAAEATKNRVRELNAELGKTSFADKARGVGRGMMSIGAGVAAGAMVMREPVRNQMDFDRRLAMVSNTAFSDRDVAGRIKGKETLFDAVQKAVTEGGGTKEDALSSLDTLLASGAVSADTALKLLPTLQKGAVATGASSEDMARIAISAMQQFGIKEEDIGLVLDKAVAAGQAGNFELADMARWLPQQMAAAKQAGLSGMEGFERLLIANQQARVTAGTSDEAGNNLVNLLAKITSKETNERFEKLEYKDHKTGKTKGIDFAKSMEYYKGKGQDSLQAFMSIMDDVVGSDKRYQELQTKLKTAKGEEQQRLFNELTNLVEGTAIGQIVSDRQALMALLGIKNNVQLGEAVQKDVQNAAGATETSHAVVRNTNAHKVEALKNTAEFAQMQNFEKVNNVLGELSQQLADYGKEYPNLTQFLVGAKDAVFAFGAALAASSVMDMLGGGKGKLLSKATQTVASGGVTAATGTAARAGGMLSGRAATGLATLAGAGLFFAGAAAGKTPYDAQQEAQKEQRAEAEKQFYQSISPKSPSAFAYGGVSMGGIKPTHNYHGAYVIANRLNDNEVAKERGKQGALNEAEVKARLDRNQSVIDNQIRPQVEGVTSALATYQTDFQAFGQSLSMGIEAGLASQSHTIANNITVELDGRVIAEQVSEQQFNFNKRMQ